MIETSNPEINVDELMNKIREEVAKRRCGITDPQLDSSPVHEATSSFNWPQIMAGLYAAEQNADAGSSILPMLRFRRVIRWLAKLTGRIVIYLAQVVTVPQRRFNQSILETMRITVNGVRDMNQSLTERDNRIAGLEETVNQGLVERDNRIVELQKTISYLKNSLILQERRVGILLEEARKRLPEPFDQEQLQTFASEETHLLDPLYLSFEDQFRGTREDIKDRLKVYVPLVREAKAGTDKRPILDVGCGRGEWLEILEEEGLTARGLDINRELVEECRDRGMDVVEGDAIEYLHDLPDVSLGAVTGFHLIEHLPFKVLIKLLDDTVRVLKPGGLAIFETPNPENILVGAYNFYFDPTHRHPLPAPMMKFLAESRGLCNLEIKPLHPYDEASRVPEDGSKLVRRFNEYFYGPQDYAVIGYKI